MPYDSITLARLWYYIDKSGSCWMWTAHTDDDGYGILKANGKNRRAHRIVCELTYGPLPPGHQARHTCDTPGCCRPAHLIPGPPVANTRDCIERGRFRGAHAGDAHHLRQHPERACRGEGRPDAKLTEVAVREIRSAYAAGGVTYHDLAARFGVNFQTITKVVKRRSWKHVP